MPYKTILPLAFATAMLVPITIQAQSTQTPATDISSSISRAEKIEGATTQNTTRGGLCLWRCIKGKWSNICERAPKTKPKNTTRYVGGACSKSAVAATVKKLTL